MIEVANSLPLPSPAGMAMVVLESWTGFGLALLLIGVAGGLVFVRKPAISRLSLVALGLGGMLLALAAGGLVWQRASAGQVAVMVDLSPSTRTARYRDVAALQQRIGQLLGSVPYQIAYFGDGISSNPAVGSRLPDLTTDRTRFMPPDAAAILLFSDGQFDLPRAAAPVYIVMDPMLEEPPDAAVQRLGIRNKAVSATVVNQGAEGRALALGAGPAAATQPVASGVLIHTAPLPIEGNEVTARLSGSDPWPENDALAIRIPPPLLSQRWWVGRTPSGGNWVHFEPHRLPDGNAEYLAPSIIVLNNVSTSDLSDLQQQRLQQYVRDLGGSVVILGGDRAFAAGAYPGSPLETISPLSSSPPTPTQHWLVLGDSSGSMAASEGGVSRWDQVTRAMRQLLPHLPPEDPVSIGSFAESLRWWSTGKSARETTALPLPPADVHPNGPTNLEDALLRIISSSDASLPKHLLLLTDADAEISQVDSLRRGLADRKIRLHLLALREEGRALKQLEELVQSSGGRSLREITPDRWTEAVRKLYEQTAPNHLGNEPMGVRYAGDVSPLPGRSVPLWNRTWLKKNATALASGNSAEGAVTLAARWKVGAGEVLAAAFPANAAEAEVFAELIARPPHDPRFKVAWETGPSLRASVDAVDGDAYLNGLSLQLELSSSPPTATGQMFEIPQTGPGRYEVSVPAPRQPAIATIHYGGRIIDRTAVAGRYAPEFDAIGNNRTAMRELASQTGGAVIPPTETQPIEFSWPRREVSLSSWLAVIGAGCIAAGLLHWRLG